MPTAAWAIGSSACCTPRLWQRCATAELISMAAVCAASLAARRAQVAPELLPLVWIPSAREDAPCFCESRRLSARRLSSLARLLPGPAFAGLRARHLRETV